MAQTYRSAGLIPQARNVIVFGATSAIAQAVCRLLSLQRCRFFLIARDAEKLAAVEADLRVREAEVAGSREADLCDTRLHPDLIAEAWHRLGTVDICLIAHGYLGDQAEAERDWAEAATILNVNFVSVASLATHLANRFEKQGYGRIVAMGSVAGDRGRKTNYVYGAAKGALETFLEGVRHRLASRGVGVLLVKPGFVDTPMTAHLPRSPLFTSPGKVARSIVSAMDKGKSTIYTPIFWRPVMLIIRLLPEWVFNRLSI